MISEWWSYRPGDFLLFSERVYWRLFELQNEALWPAQIAAIALGLLLVLVPIYPRPWRVRAALVLLAAAIAFAGSSFLLGRYAAINWAAEQAGWMFLVEAGLLLLFAMRSPLLAFATPRVATVGAGIVLYAVLLHPLVASLAGRPLVMAEVFALAPDPSAMAVLGFLAAAGNGSGVWMLRLPPLLWLFASAATLAVMGRWEAALPIVTSLAALAPAVSALARRN